MSRATARHRDVCGAEDGDLFAGQVLWQAAADQLDSLEGRLAGLENGSSRMPYDRYLNYKMADVLRGSELAEGAPRFLKEIPVIDVAATVAAGGLEAKQDHDEGWSWGHSVLVDVGGSLVALGAGVGLAASIPVDGVATPGPRRGTRARVW